MKIDKFNEKKDFKNDQHNHLHPKDPLQSQELNT